MQCASINTDEHGDGEKSRNTVAKNLGKHQNETNRLSGGFEIMFGLESECEEQCDMQQLNSCVDYGVVWYSGYHPLLQSDDAGFNSRSLTGSPLTPDKCTYMYVHTRETSEVPSSVPRPW